MHFLISNMSQLVHAIKLWHYTCTPSSTVHVHPFQLSRARLGRIYQARGLLVLTAQPSPCSSDFTISFAEGSVLQISSDHRMYLSVSLPLLTLLIPLLLTYLYGRCFDVCHHIAQ